MGRKERICIFTLAAFFSIAIFCGIRKDIRNSSKHGKLRQDCEEVKINFGNSVLIKNGFYAGVEGTAVGKDEESIEVQYLKGLELKTQSFPCGDIKVVK